jgi:hypothetical protein
MSVNVFYHLSRFSARNPLLGGWLRLQTPAQRSDPIFDLKFRPLRGQHNTATAYAWEHSGVAEVRVGPEP